MIQLSKDEAEKKFLDRCVKRARFPDKDIEADGGVSPKTIGACAKAGKKHSFASRKARLIRHLRSLSPEQPSLTPMTRQAS